jgi:N utilization substance protein A
MEVKKKMRAKNSKTTNGNPELIEALEAIAREKDISKEVLLEAIQNSLLAACKDQFGKSDNIRVVLDETTGEFHVYQDKVVVEEVLDDTLEIALAEAEARHGVTDLGATVSIEVTPKNFGRISAQKAKQVVVQKIREEERKVLYDQYYTKEKDIITGTVQRYSNGNYTVNIGKIDTVLTEQEQVKTERFRSHEKIRVYVTEVKDTPRGPRIVISRTHPELVKRLFEAEVAEIQSGVVEIKSVSREAGSRSKIAVYSRNPDVDAVGACVGMNGARVNAVVNELRGEKIDIVEWNENPAIFIEHALSPSRVVSVTVDIEEKSALVVVPDYQLSLAIGKEGQNARLAAKLTGYKIDIKSETQNQEG